MAMELQNARQFQEGPTKRMLAAAVILFAVLNTAFGAEQCCEATQEEEWGYCGRNGPSKWVEIDDAQCDGKSQSPIDIKKDDVIDKKLNALQFIGYGKQVRGEIKNDGHTVIVTPKDGVKRLVKLGKEKYLLQQFHFHFGSKKGEGSEHKIDGEAFEMEVHLVHQSKNGKLAVIGTLFKELGDDNDGFKSLVDAVGLIKYKGDTAKLPNPIDLQSLLPPNKGSHYRYSGSLTTPPCSEGVSWIVMASPLNISSDQMKNFRMQVSVTEDEESEGCLMANNFRPTQPLNGRKVVKK